MFEKINSYSVTFVKRSKMPSIKSVFLLALFAVCLVQCKPESTEDAIAGLKLRNGLDIDDLLAQYATVRLTTDVSALSDARKAIIRDLISAAEAMEQCFWIEAYGDRDSLQMRIADSLVWQYAKINFGPWDRLNGNAPFLDGIGEKPAGANFYPADMTKEEFDSSGVKEKTSLYTLLRRASTGDLKAIPYHEYFGDYHSLAAKHLRNAAKKAETTSLRKYLNLRADALMNDNYQKSDLAWLDMKDNSIDIVIGPIETYEDQLFGYKAAHEAYVLVKDMEWSERLSRYAAFLPDLQAGLPVPAEYKKEQPGTDTDLNAYDVIYYAGDCNAGSKTIAINLPNDEEVQLAKGTRRLQLKNAMQAKFDKILLPLAGELIDPSQRNHITFDAFFANTMFHEVAHGLGIKNTLDGNSTVRNALKENASALEEGKADILGIYMIKQLHDRGEIEGDIMDYYVTFMASIFRSVRFGASSAHGKANMIRFNYFSDQGAFSKNKDSGFYTVNKEGLESAVASLSEIILRIQGDGDYQRASDIIENRAKIGSELQADLDKLSKAGIPVDIVFEQGVDVLGI